MKLTYERGNVNLVAEATKYSEEQTTACFDFYLMDGYRVTGGMLGLSDRKYKTFNGWLKSVLKDYPELTVDMDKVKEMKEFAEEIRNQDDEEE
jgi:hypothetical protein